MRPGLHVVCPDRRARGVPYQSQGPHLCLHRTDGDRGRITGGSHRGPPARQSNRWDHCVAKKGSRRAGSLSCFLRPRNPTMTLRDRIDTLCEGSTPVLETARLVLRAPRFEDAKSVATLASDRRVAKNTTRIPHPYTVADAPGMDRSRDFTVRRDLSD